MEVILKPFSKPSISVAEQITLLRKRGLNIQDQQRTEHYLEVISFFRLSPYMSPFQQETESNQTFKSGTSFKQVAALYAFDRELRLLVMDAIERVEVAVRAMINNVMGAKYQTQHELYSGSHWYLNPIHFKRQFDHHRLINTLNAKQNRERGELAREIGKINNAQYDDDKKQALINLKQRENYFRFYLNNYNQPELPPCWAIMEELTLGELSHLFKGLAKDADRKQISRRFNTPMTVLANWLHTLTFVRNSCAHHGRLWNRELPIAPKLIQTKQWQLPSTLPNSNIQPIRRLFSVLLLLAYLMKQVSPDSQWVNKLLQLIARYPDVPVKSMGFPDDWQQYEFLQGEEKVD